MQRDFRVSNVLAHLGRVTPDFESFTVYPLLACFALADVNLAEVAGELNQMEHTNESQPYPTQVHKQMGHPVLHMSYTCLLSPM